MIKNAVVEAHENHDESYDWDCPICQRAFELSALAWDSTGTDEAAIREYLASLTVGDVWCAMCDQTTAGEYRQADGSTVALCAAHVIDQQWKAVATNWISR